MSRLDDPHGRVQALRPGSSFTGSAETKADWSKAGWNGPGTKPAWEKIRDVNLDLQKAKTLKSGAIIHEAAISPIAAKLQAVKDARSIAEVNAIPAGTS